MRFIEEGIAEANHYGLDTRRDVMLFFGVKCSLDIYTEFQRDEHKWIVKLLNDPNFGTPSQRLRYLYNVMLDKLELEEDSDGEEA